MAQAPKGSETRGSETKSSGNSALPYRVLARKYRPVDFTTLVGHEAMVRTLRNAIATGRIAHAFLLTGVERPEDAAQTAQKILDAVSRPLEIDGHPLYVTASIGIARCTRETPTADMLIVQADLALYRAKDNGRNRIEIASIELILDRVKRASAAADRAAAAKSAAKSAA